MSSISQKQGSVVAVSHDMIMVRFEGKGVIFKKDVLTRIFKHDDIVQFSAKKASTIDIEVGDKLSQMSNYEIEWVGTEIKYIKPGRMLTAEGAVINIPDEKGQYMFVDWKYTKNPPSLAKIPGYNKPLTTNVFITRATVRPEIDKLSEMFKPGQRVKFVAREQAPNERGVCWRAALATDEFHDIVIDAPNAQGRPTHRVIPKAGVTPPAPGVRQIKAPTNIKPSSVTATVQRPLTRPVSKAQEPPKQAVVSQPPVSVPVVPQRSSRISFQIQKPPPVDGFDYFDTTKEACAARFRRFASNYRNSNPNCIFSQKCFEGCLKIKYLNHITEELTAIRAAETDT